MSQTLNRLEAAIHGSPAGYDAGCKSRGGCPNRPDRTQLTCTEAFTAHAHYLLFARQDRTTPITRAELKTARDRTRTENPHA